MFYRHINLRIFLLVLLSFVLLLIKIDKPFIGHHDFMSAMEGNIAKNYLKYGPLNLRFAQITGNVNLNINDLKSSQATYLPMIPFLIYTTFLTFGISEFSVRLVPVIFSVVGVGFFYLILCKIYDKKVGLIGSLFYMLNPMFLYFGKLPAPEPGVLSISLVSFYIYLKWLDTNNTKHLFLLSISLFFGFLIGWTISYIGFAILIHAILIHKFKLSLLWIIQALILGLFIQILHPFIVSGYFNYGMFATLMNRLSEKNFSFGGVDYSLVTYLKQQLSWLHAYYTKIILMLSLFYFVKNIRTKINIKSATVYSLLIFGVLHPLIFPRYVFVHDFLNIYLLPFFALSACLGLLTVLVIVSKIIKSKLLINILVVFIFVLFINDKIKFTYALINSNMNYPAIDMSKLLNKIQSAPNQAVILSPRFESFYGIFTNFYSIYPYSIEGEEDFKKSIDFKKYKYIVMIDEDIRDRDFYNFLMMKFKNTKHDYLTIFYVYE